MRRAPPPPGALLRAIAQGGAEEPQENLQWELTESDYGNLVCVQLILDGILVRAQFRRPRARQAFQNTLTDVRRELLQRAEGQRRARGLPAELRDPPPQRFLPPSDPGYPGAIPLPAPTDCAVSPWQPVPFLSDAEWAAQNRKINDLLMRGKTE